MKSSRAHTAEHVLLNFLLTRFANVQLLISNFESVQLK